jgi:2-polyprenyl-3-methyl-5-hydroxy-6-metoxy-1,4-benzoquinol methylase
MSSASIATRTDRSWRDRLRLAIKRAMWPGTNWVSRDKARVVRMFLNGTAEQPIRTLDCGCGNAYFAWEAVRRGANVLGITIHDWERQSCEEMRDYLGIPEDRMRFRTCRLDDLAADPAQRGQFDQVILLDVIEHIRDDRRCLKQLHDLLDTDGFLYLTTPDRDWTANTRAIRVTRNEDGWHVRNGYTIEQLSRLLEESGFEPIDHLRIGSKGIRLVAWLQHRVFGRWIDPMSVATFPLLRIATAALSWWNDPHTVFVLARKRAAIEVGTQVPKN